MICCILFSWEFMNNSSRDATVSLLSLVSLWLLMFCYDIVSTGHLLFAPSSSVPLIYCVFMVPWDVCVSPLYYFCPVLDGFTLKLVFSSCALVLPYLQPCISNLVYVS